MTISSKIKVHIKINTGMNRIGENYKSIDNLIEVYKMKNISILGTFSHLSVSDSLNEENINFTKKQISNYFEIIEKLKELGCNVGKIHIQASYGIANYPELECDYVRAGIIMYGVYSDCNNETKVKLNLKPVLSLKARITTVKEINQGESVGYGRTFIAKEKTKIATVSIGYADGYPRSLSNKNVKVQIKGEYATIIGRICMDQLIIDVSNIKDVKQGDIVKLIGEEEEISATHISYMAENSITNELLSRLGNRLYL